MRNDLIDEIATADSVTCSVGPDRLKFIAPIVAKGIDRRQNGATPIAVIACENAVGATNNLAEHVKNSGCVANHRLETGHHELAKYANAVIDRIVPVQCPASGLDVRLERYCEWVVDLTPFKDRPVPAIEGVNWADNLAPYVDRKLYTLNTGQTSQ
ncbi:hypothetical protein EDB80DRAFT_867864 [Ilyonectria destructans]|nr:hypothetical protein EDB80DRAFT_867864 [Ilyonectria destructans]